MHLILFLISFFFIDIANAQSTDSVSVFSDEPIKPIPFSIMLDPAKVALGQKLFEDPYLAHDEKQACSQCHQLDQGGYDNLYRSITNSGKEDLINTPTIF